MMQQNLTEFEPEKLKEKIETDIEDQKIMDFLSKKTTKELADEIRINCHPTPAWKESEEDTSWRMYYLNEFTRRGLQVYIDLGWPYNDEALYVNRFTGDVEELCDIATSNGYFPETIANHSWSVVEHWSPYDASKPNEILIKYLKENIAELTELLKGEVTQTEKEHYKEDLYDKQKELIKEQNRIGC